MRSSERFLAAAADLFDETGEWPDLDDVQDLLVYRRDPTDAEREARRLSSAHGSCDDGSVCPSVEGIYAADPSHPLLEYFERVLIFGAKKYRRRKRRAKTILSRGEVIEVLGLTGEEADRALAMLVSESLASPGPDCDDAIVIAPAIRHYFAVRSVGEYVKIKSRRECRLRRGKTRKPRLRAVARGVGRAAVRIILSALAIALATFMVWLVAQAFGGNHDGNHHREKQARSGETQRQSLRSAAARSGG
jgi:hypothetical protein